MPETVGAYQLATISTPVNGGDLDADVVRGNLNSVRANGNAHDADPGIHWQSSPLASRPAAGVLGRKWLTSDDRRVFYDSGTTWQEIAYLPLAGGTVQGNVAIVGNLSFTGALSGPIDGASVTNLNANNLTSGTIPNSRFPATLPVANGSALTSLTAGNLVGALPAISGAALTGLTAPQVGPGAFPDGVFSLQTLLPKADLSTDLGNITGPLRFREAFLGRITTFRTGATLTSTPSTLFVFGNTAVEVFLVSLTSGSPIHNNAWVGLVITRLGTDPLLVPLNASASPVCTLSGGAIQGAINTAGSISATYSHVRIA